MNTNGLIIIYNNLWMIILTIVFSIIFFIIFEKYNTTKEISEEISQKEIDKKNLYLNRIDIIGNKVGIVFIVLVLIIFSIFVYYII